MTVEAPSWPAEGQTFTVPYAAALRLTYADLAQLASPAPPGDAAPLFVTFTPIKPRHGRGAVKIERDGTQMPTYCTAVPWKPAALSVIPGDRLRINAEGCPVEVRITVKPL